MTNLTLGIDIGGTFIKYGLVDEEFNIVRKWKEPTIKFETKDEFYDYICSNIGELEKVKAIGISCPGLVDKHSNIKTKAAVNVRVMFGTNVNDEISKRTGKTVATINDAKAACAVPEIIKILRDKGYNTPIIGDFHFNGHKLLANYPEMAQALSKYRVNPGNIGKDKYHDKNFNTILKIAKDNNKPIRIGINSGSLDQALFTELMDKNSKLKKPKSVTEILHNTMVCSALKNAGLFEFSLNSHFNL